MNLYGKFTTQEEIDAEYDLESALNMGPYISWLVEGSARAREDLDSDLDVRFGPTLEETVDVFPASRPGAPVVVFIHGGWWRSLSSKEFSLLARGPVMSGCTAVITNYSLCPKVSISEITRQSRAVIAWLHEHAERYHGDPDRIFVAGHSAGGHQVAMLAITDWVGEYGLPADTVKGGLPISGLFDLRPFRYSWLQPKLLLTHDTIDRQSPLFHIPTDRALPPLLVTLGGDESNEFHRQSAAFVDAWRTRGGQAQFLEQPGKDHVSAIAGLEDPDSPLCRGLLNLIERSPLPVK